MGHQTRRHQRPYDQANQAIDAQTRAEQGVTYASPTTPNPALDGSDRGRATSGTEQWTGDTVAEPNFGPPSLSTPTRSRSGTITYTSDPSRPGAVSTQTDMHDTRDAGMFSSSQTTSTLGTRTEEVDVHATERALRSRLTQIQEEGTETENQTARRYRELSSQHPNATPDQLSRIASQDPEYQSWDQRRRVAIQRREQAANDTRALDGLSGNADQRLTALRQIAGRNQVNLQESTAVTAENTDRDSNTRVSLNGTTLSADRTLRDDTRTSSTTDDQGRINANTTRTQSTERSSFDASNLGYQRQNEQTLTTTNSEGSRETRLTNTTSTAAGDGRFTVTRGENTTSTQRNADGDETSRRTTSTSMNGSLVQDPNGGSGFRVGRATSSSQRDETSSRSNSRDGNVQVTDRGASGAGNYENETGGQRVRVGTRVGLSGAYNVNVTPIAGSSPPMFNIEIQVKVGGNLRVRGRNGETSGSEPGAISASASVSFEGSETTTYRHRLNATEAARYQDELESASAGNAGSSAFPEFDSVRRWGQRFAGRATGAAENDDGRRRAEQALRDPGAARQMRDGDSIEYTRDGSVTGSANGTVNGGGVSAGVDASATARRTSTVRVATVTVNGRPLTEVQVTFGTGARTSLGASGSAEGVAARVQQSTDRSNGESVTAQLDPQSPNYDQLFRDLTGARDLQAARSAAEAAHAVTARQITSSSSQTTNVGMGSTAAPAEDAVDRQTNLGLGQTTTQSTSRTIDLQRLPTQHDTANATIPGSESASATINGTNTNNLTLSANRTRVLQANETTAANARVNANGSTTLDLSNTQSESNVGDNLRAARDAVRTNTAEGRRLDSVGTTLTQGPATLIRNALERTTTRIRNIHLEDSDVDSLIQRAGDESRWMDCVGVRGRGEWSQLRRSIRNPQLDPQLRTVDVAVATRIAQMEAIANFIASNGETGRRCLNLCLQHWGETSLNPQQQAAPVGVEEEWPPSLNTTRSRFETAREAVRNVPGRFAGERGETRNTRCTTIRDELLATLASLQTAVEAATDFADRSAKMNIVLELQRMRQSVQQAYDEAISGQTASGVESVRNPNFNRNAQQLGREGHTVATDEDRQMDNDGNGTVDGIELEAWRANHPTGPNRNAAANLADHRHALEGFKREETATFAEVRRLIAGNGFFNNNDREASEALWNMDSLYRRWIEEIQRTRTDQAGVQQLVSAGPSDTRRPALEPDCSTRASLYEQAHQGMSAMRNAGAAPAEVARQWRARGSY